MTTIAQWFRGILGAPPAIPDAGPVVSSAERTADGFSVCTLPEGAEGPDLERFRYKDVFITRNPMAPTACRSVEEAIRNDIASHEGVSFYFMPGNYLGQLVFEPPLTHVRLESFVGDGVQLTPVSCGGMPLLAKADPVSGKATTVSIGEGVTVSNGCKILPSVRLILLIGEDPPEK